MKVCREFILLLKECVIIAIIVSVLHCIYEISGRNLLVALFSAVNESILEHVKIAIFSIYIYEFSKMWIFEKREQNLWSMLLLKVVIVTCLISLLIFIYKNIIWYEVLFIDIFICVISIFTALFLSRIVDKKIVVSAKTEEKCMYLNLFIVILFIILTICSIVI